MPTYSLTRLREHPAVRLLPEPNESYASTSTDAAWRKSHINAVRLHLYNGSARPAEERILSLLDGLEAYIGGSPDINSDYYGSSELAPALYSAASLLNLDCGNLDAGTLSSWIGTMFERIGWNQDLNESL